MGDKNDDLDEQRERALATTRKIAAALKANPQQFLQPLLALHGVGLTSGLGGVVEAHDWALRMLITFSGAMVDPEVLSHVENERVVVLAAEFKQDLEAAGVEEAPKEVAVQNAVVKIRNLPDFVKIAAVVLTANIAYGASTEIGVIFAQTVFRGEQTALVHCASERVIVDQAEDRVTTVRNYRITAASGLNLRDLPAFNGGKIAALPYGSIVTVYSYSGEWAWVAVSVGGDLRASGWLHSKYLEEVRP